MIVARAAFVRTLKATPTLVTVVGALVAAPILLFRYPPMPDLAMHEAMVAVARHRADAAFVPAGMYSVVAPQCNQLFHWLAYALSFAVPTDTACKTVVAAAVAGIVAGMGRLLALRGACRWPALVIAPVACGWMFRWGLAPNLVGFALLLWCLPVLESLWRRPRVRSACLASLAAAALLFAHASSALAFAVVALFFAAVRGKSLAAFAVRAAPVGVVAALGFLQRSLSARLSSETMERIGTDYGLDPAERLSILPGAILGGSDGVTHAILASAMLAALAAAALAKRRGPARALPLCVALGRHRYAVLGLVFFFAYLLFPMSIGGTTLLAHRFLPPAIACLVVACAPRSSSRLGAVLAVLVPVALVALEWPGFVDGARAARDLDAIILRIPPNVAVAQLDFTPRPRGHVAPVPGLAARVQAERGGRMLFSFADTPPNPVYVRREWQWNEPVLRLAAAPYALVPARDARRFGYLVARDTDGKVRALVARALSPEYELVEAQGPWDLFRSTLPLDAIASPDVSPPVPPVETLADRVNRLVAAATAP
jgi:hypothetical protein